MGADGVSGTIFGNFSSCSGGPEGTANEERPGRSRVSLCKPLRGSQLKELPQPQLRVTFGFSMANPAPMRPSL